MKIDFRSIVCLCGLALAACTTAPERVALPEPETVTEEVPMRPRSSVEEIPLRAMLAFYATNARTPGPAPRERPLPADPYLKMQQAIQLGHLRPPELQRGMNLLASVMKDSSPSAVSLAPLARVLYDQYSERLRLEVERGRLEQQAREAQRRSEQLQEKIDALSAIERSLPSRAAPALLPQTQSRQAPPTTGAEESAR